MIQLNNILNSIIGLLNQQSNGMYLTYNQVVSAKQDESDGDDLVYPYTSINVTSQYIQQTENVANVSRFMQGNDLIERRKEQPTITLSVVSYSKDEMQAIETNQNTMSFFKHILYEELSTSDIIVVEITSSTNRTSILEVEYEYRYAFDVILRVKSQLDRIIPISDGVDLTVDSQNQSIDF